MNVPFEPDADPTPATTRERRAMVRYASDASGVCHPGVVRQERSWPVRVLDVSATGARLVGPRRFEPGTLLGLELEAVSGPLQRPLLARVVWLHRDAADAWVLGCALLTGLTEDELRDLSRG